MPESIGIIGPYAGLLTGFPWIVKANERARTVVAEGGRCGTIFRNENDVARDRAMINARKTTQDIRQEEMLRERAAVLARAGERLAAAMEKLGRIDAEISEAVALWHSGEVDGGAPPAKGREPHRLLTEINAKIHAYNRQREQVKTRYYYLVVTREALGLIHHQRLAEIYRLPPKKHCLPEP